MDAAAGRRQLWKVVGGDGRGGLLVRTGAALASEKASGRLGNGALLEELSFADDRLHFRKLLGVGPAEGWITVTLHSRALAERVTSQELPVIRGLLATHEAYVQLPPGERRLRSWSRTLAASAAWLQMSGRARRGTSLRPFVFWILGATGDVEGALAAAGLFDDANALDGQACDLVFWGCSSGGAKSTQKVAQGKDKPPRLRFEAYDALPAPGSAAQQPDLIAVLMPDLTVRADGRLSTSRAFLPEAAAKCIGSRPVVVSTRFACCPEDALRLADALAGKSQFIMRRNIFSALSDDPNVLYDDNGWITCVDGMEGLTLFLEHSFMPAVPDQYQAESKSSALFWGIVDLKYDPSRPVQDRVRVLELGDGKSSKFSNDGAPIQSRFKERYTLEDASIMGSRSLIPANKKLTHDLIERHAYGHLLPRQICLPRVYQPGLAAKIARALGVKPRDLVVLKLLNRSRGAGVLPVPVERLDAVLQDVLLLPDNLEDWFHEHTVEGSTPLADLEWGCFEEQRRNWWSNECPYFVAEQFCNSTPVDLGGKRFDGTLRVAFALRRRDGRRPPRPPAQGRRAAGNAEEVAAPPLGELTVDWLGGYWKLPKDDVDSPDLRERVISAARVAGTATVEPAQLFEVYAALGDLPQKLFGGAELDVDTIRRMYAREPALASYLVSRLSVTMTTARSAKVYLQEAKDLLLNMSDGVVSRCSESYANRCLGVLEAMTGAGCWSSAKSWFRRSLDDMPSNSTSLYLMGMVALELGHPQQAVDWMTKSLLVDPDFKAPYVNLGAAYLRLRRYDEAIAISDAAMVRHPETPHCYYHIGLACYYKAVDCQAHHCRDGVQGSEPLQNGSLEALADIDQLRERALFALSESRASEEWSSRPKLESDDAIFRALKSFAKGARLPDCGPSPTEGWCFVGRVGRKWQPG